MSYPYSFGSHSDFEHLKLMWDKAEQNYNQTKKVLEEQGALLKKEVEVKVKEIKSRLQWLYRIDSYPDNWMTIVKTCISSDEEKNLLDSDSIKDRTSRRFKIIANNYLIIGDPIGNSYHSLPILENINNGLILPDDIIHDIVDLGKVPNDPKWNFKF